MNSYITHSHGSPRVL